MIGVFGGTFDPVHLGHLRLAWEAAESLQADELRMIPACRPPHRAPPQASASDRLAMLDLALAGQTRLRLDRREYDRPGPSYMVDTLASLRAEIGPRRPLCLILGADAYLGLPGWQRWEGLIGLAHLLVLQRPDSPQPDATMAAFDAAHRVPLDALADRPAGGVAHIPGRQLDISASDIRARIASGRSPRYLIPDAVLRYIHDQRLYQSLPITKATH